MYTIYTDDYKARMIIIYSSTAPMHIIDPNHSSTPRPYIEPRKEMTLFAKTQHMTPPSFYYVLLRQVRMTVMLLLFYLT